MDQKGSNGKIWIHWKTQYPFWFQNTLECQNFDGAKFIGIITTTPNRQLSLAFHSFKHSLLNFLCMCICVDQTYTQQKGVRVLSKTAGMAANVVVAAVWKPNIAT
jgi:hypothetical protein